jgi:hypothetical protein
MVALALQAMPLAGVQQGSTLRGASADSQLLTPCRLYADNAFTMRSSFGRRGPRNGRYELFIGGRRRAGASGEAFGQQLATGRNVMIDFSNEKRDLFALKT